MIGQGHIKGPGRTEAVQRRLSGKPEGPATCPPRFLSRHREIRECLIWHASKFLGEALTL